MSQRPTTTTAVVVMEAMVAETYNNQLISAVEETTEAGTAMAAVMAMVGGDSNVADNKLKKKAKETAVMAIQWWR